MTLKKCLPLFVCLVALNVCIGQDKKKDPIRTIEELKSAIEAVLEETETPAVGIALVDQNGPIWATSLGKADIENDIDATENTMFRIGSTSKMFASLSILKLQEQGLISLKDKVRNIVPEIEFTNQWEATNPILVEHLLEHTTGWDDLHLCEYGLNDPTPISLKEGLDYHPHSRISRWVPGTRMSYCNSGPPVAAYIVQKLTGLDYEAFVKTNFWDVMSMENMTYLKTPVYDRLGAKLYDGGKEQEYWHILMRPSGSINASPIDMAKMVSFFINRGKVDSIGIITEASLQRMENSESTLGAVAGLEVGYGLSNYTSDFEGYTFHGHNGGVNGGLTDMAYLPEANLGYAIMINSGNGGALRDISKLIKGYLIKDFEPIEQQYSSAIKNQAKEIDGYYMPINPRTQMFYFIERLANNRKIWTNGDTIYQKSILGGPDVAYTAATSTTYRSANTGKISMAQISDPLTGEGVQMETVSFQKVLALSVYVPLLIGALWVLAMVLSIVLGIIWFIRYMMGHIPGGANIMVRFWPMLASLLIALSFIFFTIGGKDPFELLARPSFASLGIMMGTLGFGITAIWSLIKTFLVNKADVNAFAYNFSKILSGLHFLAVLFFLYYGVIGLQTWA